MGTHPLALGRCVCRCCWEADLGLGWGWLLTHPDSNVPTMRQQRMESLSKDDADDMCYSGPWSDPNPNPNPNIYFKPKSRTQHMSFTSSSTTNLNPNPTQHRLSIALHQSQLYFKPKSRTQHMSFTGSSTTNSTQHPLTYDFPFDSLLWSLGSWLTQPYMLRRHGRVILKS